jgi:hypothetical protein
MGNYGHAGAIFIQYVIQNLDAVKAEIARTQAKLDKDLHLTQRERFWSSTTACNIVGGKIAVFLGLIDWNMSDIYTEVCHIISGMREEVAPPPDNAAAIIGSFVNHYMQNILVVNDALDKRTNMPTLPVMEPRGELMIRYEPDTKHMYIVVRALKDYCVERQINYKEAISRLKEIGIFLSSGPKRMSKGMKINSPPVNAIQLDCSNTGFIDVETTISGIADGSGGS